MNARDMARYEEAKKALLNVGEFSYGAGSNYPNVTLGHDDVIRMTTDFRRERPLFRTLLMQQFPFVFIDESQDTQAAVVEAMNAVALQAGSRFCLGFFGDPMQKIYLTGMGALSCRCRMRSRGHEFEAMTLLRKHCPLLARETMQGKDVSDFSAICAPPPTALVATWPQTVMPA
ncbi:MAG: UvrD-helicase domain-containing protein [Janthinobacterium lividum]